MPFMSYARHFEFPCSIMLLLAVISENRVFAFYVSETAISTNMRKIRFSKGSTLKLYSGVEQFFYRLNSVTL